MSSARHSISAQKQRQLMRPWWSLWTSWCVVALCALLCGSAVLAIGVLRNRPLYRASATMSVTSAAAQNSGLETTLIPFYADLSITRPVLAAVAARYPGVTVDTLVQEVSVTTSASSATFQINVRDPSAARAALLARDVANEAPVQIQRTLGRQYTVEEQVLQQDLQSTTTQIGHEKEILGTTSPSNPQSRVQIQGQLAYLQQLKAIDEQVLSQIQAAERQAPNPLRLDTVSDGERVGTVTSYTPGAVAALCGVGIGIALELAVATRRQRVGSQHDVEALVDAPVLAVLSPPESKHDDGFAFTYFPVETAVELPRSLLVMTVRGPSQPSAALEALAIGLAGGGRRTLLVDADLRRDALPISESGMDVPAAPGLSDMVLAAAGRKTAQSVSQPVSLADTIHELTPSGSPASGARALRVMPRGISAPNPLGVLGSSAMGEVYRQILGYGADLVIFAGPPLLDSAETSFLAGQLGTVVLVVESRRLHRADLVAAADRLRACRARLLGCVLVDRGLGARRTAQESSTKSDRPSLPPLQHA